MIKSFPLILVSSLLFFLVVFVPYSQNKAIHSKHPRTSVVVDTKNRKVAIVPTATVNTTTIKLEIADSQKEWSKGLSGRDSLESNSGMLFIFDKHDIRPSFWMKDMHFAIDIIWINDGKIVDITKEAPYPADETPDYQLPLYTPSQAIDYVLEVNSGFTDAHNIQIGNHITFTNIQF